MNWIRSWKSESNAAGKEEGPIRLGGTKARREVTRDIFTGKKKTRRKEQGKGPSPESLDVLSLCLDPNSCLKANTF